MSGKTVPMGEMVSTIISRYGITKADFDECIKRTIETLPDPKNRNNRRNVITSIFKNKQQLQSSIAKELSDEAVETATLAVSNISSDAETSSVIPESIEKFTFQITSLVCGQFKGTVQEFIERELKDAGSSCGARAYTIASNLVKVAATRIFADPSQSIMELLTNSIDSYRRMNAVKSGKQIPPSIGKFGMGFMSILWWVLNKTSSSAFPPKLVIVSTLPGQLPYMAGIYAKDDELWCDYHENVSRAELEKSPLPYFHRPHGTSIQLYVSGYAAEVLNLFKAQISKLRYVQDVIIKVDPMIQSQEILNSIESPTNTIIYRENISFATRDSDRYGIFIVDDFAEGIPKSVFFGSLLAPSLSTKTLTTKSQIVLSIRPSRIEKYQDYGGIVITVGDIVVVGPRTIGNPEEDYYNLNRFDYIISLPITTSLPVSRDDVILTHGSLNYGNFLGEIRNLVDYITKNTTQNYSLDFFIKSLKKYADYSGQPAAYTLITDTLDYIKSKEDVALFVPTEILAKIVNENFTGYNAVVFSGCSLEKITTKVSRLCDTLHGNYGKKLIKGIRIIPVSGITNCLNGGVPSLLFFPLAWKNLPIPELIANIITTTPRLILEDAKEQDSTLDDMWNSYWGSYIPESFKEFFVHDAGISRPGNVQVALSLENGIPGDRTGKIAAKCAKYKGLHHEATSFYDFAAKTAQLYNSMIDVYEKYKDGNVIVMKDHVKEAGYELLQYLIENNDEFLSTVLNRGSEYLVDFAIVQGVEIFQIPDGFTSNFIFRQYGIMYNDPDSSIIQQYVLHEVDSYKDLLLVFENIIKLSPIRLLLSLRFLLTYKRTRYIILKYYKKLPDVVVNVRNRALDLCNQLGINKAYIFIGGCLIDPNYKAGYKLNQIHKRYETLIRTLFSAIFAFAGSLSSNHVKIFGDLRIAHQGFHSSSSIGSHMILTAVLNALKLVLQRYHSPSPSSSVITCFSSSSSDMTTTSAHSRFIEEYISLLIAYFTSLNIDCVYGGQMTLVYDYVPIFWPSLAKEFLIHSTIGNFSSSDFDQIERRDDLFNDALLQSLYICKFEGRHAIKHFTFVNGLHFQDLTIKALISCMQQAHRPYNQTTYEGKEFPLRELVDLANQITRKCITGFEGSLVALVMYRYIYSLRNYDEVDDVSRWVDMIFSEVRIKYSIEFMDTWKNYNHTFENRTEYRDFYDASFFIPLQNTLRMCMIYARQGPMGHPLLSGCSSRSGCRTVTITANQLIDYTFSENNSVVMGISTNADLLSFLQRVESWTFHQTRKQQFQMVQIAANEGTSKPFVDSVLTELVQNSVDAIRVLHASQPNPSYEKDFVNIVITEDAISVGDTVGIPPSAYLSLLIPFLSSKSGSLITTGEMGTGLFNIYRQPWCAYVSIVSNDIEIVATPILDPLFIPSPDVKSYARVLDIRYQISIPENDVVEKRGTLVTVNLSNVLTLEQKVSLAMEGSIHTQSQLSFIPSRIDLNGKTVTLDVVNLYETEVGRCYYVASGVQYPSVLLTNGVPMGLLSPYLTALYGQMFNSDLANGVVIDLNKKYYNATQSRNRLVSIPRDTDAELNSFIKSATYRCLIRKLYDKAIVEKRFDVLEAYLPNSNSRGEIEQFQNYSGSRKLAVDGNSFFESHSIPITLNSVFKHKDTSLADIWHSVKMMLFALVTGLGGSHMGKIDENLMNEWNKNQKANHRNYEKVGININKSDIEILKRIIATTEDGFFAANIRYAEIPEATELILNWFLEKYYAPPTKHGHRIGFVTKKSEKVTEDDVVISEATQRNLEEFKKIMAMIAKAYFAIGKKLDVNGLSFSKGAPKINVTPDRGHFAAYYSKDEHAITFAYGSIEEELDGYVASWKEFKNILATSSVTSATGYLRLKSPLWNIFGGKTPASTLVHEMQHALFSQNHSEGDAHGNHTFMLEGKRYDLPFENACRLVFDTIVTKGFLLKICELA